MVDAYRTATEQYIVVIGSRIVSLTCRYTAKGILEQAAHTAAQVSDAAQRVLNNRGWETR